MSQNAAISSLEGLELQPQIIARLKNAGIESIFDLATFLPQDLLEHCVITDERLALDLVMRAQKALNGSEALAKNFSTADDLLKRRQNLDKCTTGSSRLDSFLKGGIETQAMTEIAGEYASGKTQLCYTLCVTATLPSNKVSRGSVISVHDELWFFPNQIQLS